MIVSFNLVQRGVFVGLCALLIASPLFGQFDVSVYEAPAPQEFAGFGRSLQGIGDVNNDGSTDLMISSPTEDVDNIVDVGRVYIISGSDGVLLYDLDTPNPQQFGIFGFTLGAAEDLNNDGVADLLIGSQEAVGDLAGAGRVYVFSGADGTPLYSLEPPEAEKFAWFSRALVSIADINNDGAADFVVSSGMAAGGSAGAGRVHVFSGLDGGLLYSIDSPSPVESGLFGLAIANAGDLNNDGSEDLVIGSKESVDELTFAGRAYIFNGMQGNLIHELISPNPAGNGQFGWSVAGAGDLNGDLTGDVVIGSFEDRGGFFDAGVAYAFSGADGGLLLTLESPNLQHAGWFSRSVSGTGDVDNDGNDDMLIGAPFEGADGGFETGRAYLFSGVDGALLHTLESPNAENFSYFGFSLSGDWNQGRNSGADLLISGYSESVDGLGVAGRVYRFTSKNVSIDDRSAQIPADIKLHQNYPNPFNPETVIGYSLLMNSSVQLDIYNMAGQSVRRLASVAAGIQPAGQHSLTWDGRNDSGAAVASGVYVYRLSAGTLHLSKKMILLR